MFSSSALLGQPLDVISWQAAWDTLCQKNVTSDDEMHDYSLSQAYRSLAHAFFTDPPGPTSSKASPTATLAGHGVLRLLSLSTLHSPAQRSTAVFIFVKLLVEEGSAHGESNRVPEVSSHMPQWIVSYAQVCLSRVSSSSTNQNVLADQRKLSTGLAILLREGCVCLSNTARAQGTFICSMLPELIRNVVDVVHPLLASLAEGLDDEMNRRISGEQQADASIGIASPPTRRTVECNLTLLVLCHLMLEDVVTADTASANNSNNVADKEGNKKRMVVVDTSLGPLMWEVERTFTKAMMRHEQWLRESALRAKRSFRASHEQKSETVVTQQQQAVISEELAASLLFAETERWALADLTKLWSVEVVEPLRRQYEDLGAALLANQRGFSNVDTKDAVHIRSAQWGLTMRLCVLTTSVARGLVDPFVNSNSVLVHRSQMSNEDQDQVHQEVVKGLVGQVSHHVAQLEVAETPHQALVARMTMLSVASMLFFSFPMEAQQEQLWSSCCSSSRGPKKNFTEMFHQALLMRPLHFRDVVVVRLATLVSSSILHSVAGSARYNAVDIGGEELLELMRSGRDDGASRGAVQMVAMACMTRPHATIPSLFKMLDDKSNKAARDNALDVLDCLPRLLTASSPSSASPSVRESNNTAASTTACESSSVRGGDVMLNRAKRVRRSQEDRLAEVIRILGNHLLMSLGQDEELHHRQHAAALFAMMDPSDVVRPLVVMQLKRDTAGKRRDAATRALAAVLSSGGLRKSNVTDDGAHHQDARLSGVLEFLSTCRSLIAEKLEEELNKTSTAVGHNIAADGGPSSAAALDTASSEPAAQKAPTTPADIFMMASLQQMSDTVEPAATDVLLSPDEVSSPQSSSDLSKRLLLIVSSTVQQWAAALLMPSSSDALPIETSSGLLVAVLKGTLDIGQCDASSSNSSGSAVVDAAHQLAIRAATSMIVGAMTHFVPNDTNINRCEALEQRASTVCGILCVFLGNVITALSQAPTTAVTTTAAHGRHQQQITFQCLFSLLCLKAIPSSIFHFDECSDHAFALVSTLVRFLTELDRVLGAAGPHTVDAVRKILLELLCKLPPHVVLPILRSEASFFMDTVVDVQVVSAAPSSSPAASSVSLAASAVSYRAYLFVLQHQTVVETKLSFDLPTPLDHPSSATAVRRRRLQETLEEELGRFMVPMVAKVLLWYMRCMSTNDRTSSMTNTASYSTQRRHLGDESCTKLWLSGIDALALLFVVNLRNDSVQQNDDQEGAAAAVATKVWKLVFTSVMAPLSWDHATLRAALLNPIAPPTSSNAGEDASKPPALLEVINSAWLTILQASVKIVVQQETVSRGWVQQWARAVLPRIINAANALVAARGDSGTVNSAASATVAAVRRLIAPMFALVVLRPPQHPAAAAAPPSSSTEEEDEGRLLSLDPEDEAALLDFSTGCLGYEAEPLIQFEGIKLAAACIGRLPQRALLEKHHQQSRHHDGATSNLAGTFGVQAVIGTTTRIDVMMARLSKMAMMHPIAEARQLAEQVVGMLAPSASQ
ncbi:Hypothetical protein, putative [Bodo saltans]|uniref:Uncharacterized protein n=1 Tax=Bodo saltans TaxID=75058 RepID=A0A0S4JD60_BODSA|nr:Hypothetical protein, putative [Bodo saltans]|eukprot:CUG86238.1 Hypothetical protein, putative [Bodo saltans]